MIEIIEQYEDKRENMNGCPVFDVLVFFRVHKIYVVEVVRKYANWNGLDFRSRKEFHDYADADMYYVALINNVADR